MPLDHLTFTGGHATGTRVLKSAADAMTPCIVELGGKSPHIVFDSADIDQVVEAIVGSALLTSGQVCSAGTRVLVQESIHDELRSRLVARARSLGVGHAVADPDVGPLVSRTQQQSVLKAIEGAVGLGSQLLTGGRVDESNPDLAEGFFVLPTIFDSVRPESPLANEEVFGPVIAVMPFADVDDACRLANGTDFGLAAGVWTRDIDAALVLAQNLRVGQVYVNNYGVGGAVELPFGGYKRSGIGRQKGHEGILAYTQIKNVSVKLNPTSMTAQRASATREAIHG